MKQVPIVVAMEASANGEPIREAFVMVPENLSNAEQWEKTLPLQFETGTYKTQWASPRAKIAEDIHRRGNKLVAKVVLF